VDASAAQWFEKFDPITADFTYVRWLGDRKGIEEQTKVWDKIIVDRSAIYRVGGYSRQGSQTENSDICLREQSYAGHGPATVEMFQQLWRGR